MAGRAMVLVAGLVAALAVLLWLKVRTTEPAPASAVEAKRPTAATRETPAPAIAPPAPAPRPAAATHTPAPALAPSAPLPNTPAETATPKPPTFKAVLRDQVQSTESLVADCNDKAIKSGTKIDGAAAVSFTLARKDGKIVVESTGVEYSSLGDQTTLECIRDTAKAINVEALPDGVDAVVAYRKVVIKNGALSENWMTQYTVVRPPPAP